MSDFFMLSKSASWDDIVFRILSISFALSARFLPPSLAAAVMANARCWGAACLQGRRRFSDDSLSLVETRRSETTTTTTYLEFLVRTLERFDAAGELSDFCRSLLELRPCFGQLLHEALSACSVLGLKFGLSLDHKIRQRTAPATGECNGSRS